MWLQNLGSTATIPASHTLSAGDPGISVSAWTRIPSTFTGRWHRIIDCGTAATGAGDGIEFGFDCQGSLCEFRHRLAGVAATMPFTAPQNEWMHLAATVDYQGNLRVLFNGRLAHHQFYALTLSLSLSTCSIAATTESTPQYGNLQVAAFTMWPRVLTTEELRQMFLSPPTSLTQHSVLSVSPRVIAGGAASLNTIITLNGASFGCGVADIQAVQFGPWSDAGPTMVSQFTNCASFRWIGPTRLHCILPAGVRTDVKLYFRVMLGATPIQSLVLPNAVNAIMATEVAESIARLEGGASIALTLRDTGSWPVSLPTTVTLSLGATNELNGFAFLSGASMAPVETKASIRLQSTIAVVQPKIMAATKCQCTSRAALPASVALCFVLTVPSLLCSPWATVSASSPFIHWNLTAVPVMVVALQIVSFSIAPLLTPLSNVTITVSVTASIQGAANVSLAVEKPPSSVVANPRSFNSTVAQNIVFTAPSASPAVIFVSFAVSGSDAAVFYTPSVISIPVLALASNSLRMTVDTPTQTLLAGISDALSTSTLTFTPSQPVLDPAHPLVVSLSTSAGTLMPSTLIFTPSTASLSVSLVTPLSGPSVTITASSRASGAIKSVKFPGGNDMGHGLSTLTSSAILLASKDFTFWSVALLAP